MSDLVIKIEEIVDLFYQQKEHEGYEKLGNLLGELILISRPLFSEKLLMAMTALENRDVVLLADILNYEIKPML